MHTYLSGYCDLGQRLVADWTSCAVGVVKDDSDASFGYARLATLVYQVLLVLRTHLSHPCKAKGQFLALSSESLIGTMPLPVPEYPWTTDADRPVRYQQE